MKMDILRLRLGYAGNLYGYQSLIFQLQHFADCRFISKKLMSDFIRYHNFIHTNQCCLRIALLQFKIKK